MDTEDELATLNNFAPSKLLFVNFYNQDACIVWNTNTLVILGVPLPVSLTEGVIKQAPGTGVIKDIKCLKNKIYVSCSPSGILKLSQDHSFARVSSSGIGIGLSFYQVFAPKNNILYCENKHQKSAKPVFNINGDVQNIKFLHLYADETHPRLKKALIGEKNSDSCLITNQNNLLLFCNDETKIVFNCNTPIVDITSFSNKGNIFGIILLTDIKKIVLIYPRKDQLKIEQVYLDTKPNTLCSSVCTFDENKIWIIYSDNEQNFHLLKNLNNDESMTTLSIIDKEFCWLDLYKGKQLSGLVRNESDSVCLFQVPIEQLELIGDYENTKEEDKIQLRPGMIEGTELVMNEISEKVEELTQITESLEKERNLLRRINMYAIKKRVECIPKIKIYCLPDRKLIVANFQKNLPQGSQVVMSIHQDNGQIFVIKSVTDSETIVELSVPNEKIKYPSVLRVHLIAVNVKNGPWCLIDSFIKDPIIRHDAKQPLETDKLNFLNNKKMVLKKLMSDKKIDMKTLSDMKKSIRRELPEV